MEARKPLEGIVVLDFTHALAGPYCTSVLGQFGAKVIKIEGVGKGDAGRGVYNNPRYSDPIQGSDSFISFNHSKYGISVNMRTDEGKRLIREMILKADIMVSNYRPGTMEAMGFGYEEVKKINSRIIFAEIAAFPEGPDKNLAGMDIVVQAKAGTIASTGVSEDEIAKPSPSLSDMTGGMNALQGILIALYNREITGKGQQIKVAMLDATMLLYQQYVNALVEYEPYDIKPSGLIHSEIVPCEPFKASDGLVYIAVGTNKLWMALCEAMGVSQFGEDKRFLTNGDRFANKAEMKAFLDPIFITKTVDEWVKILAEYGIPVAPIVTPKRAFKSAVENHSTAVAKVQHPYYGDVYCAGTAIRLSDTPGYVEKASPRLGEDTFAVFKEYLGKSEEELLRMEADGVLGQYREK